MTTAVFDKALELIAWSNTAVTATASSTGVQLYPRALPTCDWVIHVTAIDATSADETYVFTLEVSDVVGGTYTPIATWNWPRGHGVGKAWIPINALEAEWLDNDCMFMRVTATLGGTTPSIKYGSYLAKSSNRPGYARKPGDIVTVA